MDSTQKVKNKQESIFLPFKNELTKDLSLWNVNLLWIVAVFSIFTTGFLGYIAFRDINFNIGDIQIIYNYPDSDWIRSYRYFFMGIISIPIIYLLVLISQIKRIYSVNPKIVIGILWLGIFQNIFLIVAVYQIIRLNI
jgi:hypothetical protein